MPVSPGESAKRERSHEEALVKHEKAMMEMRDLADKFEESTVQKRRVRILIKMLKMLQMCRIKRGTTLLR